MGISGKREEDSHRRRENWETGDSMGHLTNVPAPGQRLPTVFSKCLGTEP